MGVSGPSPLQSDNGFGEYMGHAGQIRRRVTLLASRLPEVRTTDHGFMAAVMALRVIVEGAPQARAILIAKGEVDHWQECYLAWFERMKRRFPKKVDPEAVKARALEEFARLREIGVRLPESHWKSGARLSLKIAEREEALRAQAREEVLQERREAIAPKPASPEKPRDKWWPCRLMTFPESMGKPRHSLTFSEFEPADKAFEKLELSNDGYSWRRLVELQLAEVAPDTLPQLSFDCESSMFCVRSSKLPPLETVREAIVGLLSDKKGLSRLLKKLQAEEA